MTEADRKELYDQFKPNRSAEGEHTQSLASALHHTMIGSQEQLGTWERTQRDMVAAFSTAVRRPLDMARADGPSCFGQTVSTVRQILVQFTTDTASKAVQEIERCPAS